jgi:hypothetical protein
MARATIEVGRVMGRKKKTITEITPDMVGLKIAKIRCWPTIENNEYTVHILLREISEEGLEVMKLEVPE